MSVLRADGRAYGQARELSIQYEGLDRADGSARFGFGETKALASVSGPIEVRLAAEQASRATFEVIVRPLSNIPGTESKSFSSTIRSLLSPSLLLTHNPRTLIQLVIQSLTPTSSPRFHPSLAASLINASTLALINTGSVPMRGVTCAIAVGRLRVPSSSNTASKSSHPLVLVLDPTEDEASAMEGGGCFAFLFGTGLAGSNQLASSDIPGSELVWTNWQATTPFDEDELVRARNLAKVGAESVWRTMKESVEWMGAPFHLHQWKEAQLKTGAAKGGNDAGTIDDDKMEI